MGDYQRTIISLSNLKEGLVYFDNVIPFDVGSAAVEEELRTGRQRPPFPSLQEVNSASSEYEKVAVILSRANLTPEVFPKELRHNNKFLESFRMLFLAKFLCESMAYGQDEANERATFAFLRMQGPKFLQFLADYNLLETPIDIFSRLTTGQTGPATDVAITIMSLNLIDVDNTSLEHILEFRKDRDSLQKMGDFRLFAYDAYAGKSQHYIEDDIHRRIRRYEQEREKWDFRTRTGSLTILLNSRNVGGTFLGSLISHQCGQNELSLALGAAGIILTLAGIAIDVRMQHFELRKITMDNPVSYISYAKQQLAERAPGDLSLTPP